jgi:hypothetical protein
VFPLFLLQGKINLPSFGATLHIGIRAPRIARVDKARVALRGQGLVDGTCEAVRPVTRARANIARQPSKGAAVDTPGVAIFGREQVAEVVVIGEHVRLGELASVQRLVPPRKGPVEAALGAQDLLKCPHVVAVPNQELGIAVDVGHRELVEAHQILVAARRGRELARRRLLQQALNSIHKGQPVRGRVLAPFEAHARLGTACRRRGCLRGGRRCLQVLDLDMRRIELEPLQIIPRDSIFQRDGMELRECRRWQAGT